MRTPTSWSSFRVLWSFAVGRSWNAVTPRHKNPNFTPARTLAKMTSDEKSYSSTFLNYRGKKMFAMYWEPESKPRALVFISHGLAEHCLPYDKLSKALTACGFFVFAHDHVGHGQSGGSRVHIDDFNHYVDDVFQHMNMMKKQHPDTPIFLCGHSMGGAISILAAMRKPDEIEGVALIAPAVTTNPELVTRFKVTASRILRSLLPGFPIGRLDISSACSCPVAVRSMKEDPLRYHGCIKAGLGACMIDALNEIRDSLPTITFPFIILQGDEDKLCDPKGAHMMFEEAASIDKTIKVYPKSYHALLLEPNGVAERVLEDVVEWLKARA